jgi:hypothetical protein
MRKRIPSPGAANEVPDLYEQPYRAFWRSLTPRERLRRAWKLRKRVPDIHRLHDAKLLPIP